MKRTRLRRKTPLKRGKPLPRGRGPSPDRRHDWQPDGDRWWWCPRCNRRVWQYDRPGSMATPCPGMKQGGRIRSVNPERKARSRGGAPGDPRRHTYGVQWFWASSEPCVVCRTVDGTPADHWDTVGTGGRDNRALPICAKHNTRHELGVDTWADTHGVDVEAELAALDTRWKALPEEERTRVEEEYRAWAVSQ